MRFTHQLRQPVSIAPLAVFRVIFGFMMLLGVIRFAANGWIDQFYIQSKFTFPFLGFEWVKPLGETGMYALFVLMGLSAFMIMIGWYYRIFSVLFFLSFTYVELIDKTYYLNHYYFISIVSFLMLFLPAHRWFSVDAKRNPACASSTVPAWMIGAIRLQLGMVYVFAGIAKLETSWLIEAQPLRIWLPVHMDMPIIGPFLDEVWVAYFFSWFGCIYDLTIPFFLMWNKTRVPAYITVIVFHVLTRMLFPIGMFPYIMILSTLIFFPANFHERIIGFTGWTTSSLSRFRTPALRVKLISGIFLLHFIVQLILPFRYLAYPGNLFWTEEGFRFSWRVMLMEKGGTTLFTVGDPSFPGTIEIVNANYLSPFQEKQMSFQPDMILQFAHFLHDEFKDSTIVIRDKKFTFRDPIVKANSFVSLNGKAAKRFVDPTVNLAKEPYNLKHRNWVMPYED